MHPHRPAAGRTCYGAVSQVEQADGEFHTYAGRRVPKYVSSAEGNTRTLTISSRPLLIPNNKTRGSLPTYWGNNAPC